MGKFLLKIVDLYAEIDGKPILKGLNLTLHEGEVHVIMGPNGAGKSTLVNIVMGHPKYKITEGSIWFRGEDITGWKTDERARRGIFLSFQNPEEVPGLTVENLLRNARQAITGQPVKMMAFKKELAAHMEELRIDAAYASRYLNVGFSGGEKKKHEILQMLMIDPRLAILDETDSGLDVDAVKIVSAGINRFRNEKNAVLVITHNTKILQNLNPHRVHILVDGKIETSGDDSLIAEINEKGFAVVRSLS